MNEPWLGPSIQRYAYVLITKLGCDMCGSSRIQVKVAAGPLAREREKAAIYKMQGGERKTLTYEKP